MCIYKSSLSQWTSLWNYKLAPCLILFVTEFQTFWCYLYWNYVTYIDFAACRVSHFWNDIRHINGPIYARVVWASQEFEIVIAYHPNLVNGNNSG